MAGSRYTGNGFTNPLNPLSLHSENHYRTESPIGYSFMSDESRVFHGLGSFVSKQGLKTASKIAVRASARVSKKALKKVQGTVVKVATSKTSARLATVGILAYTGYETFTAVVGTDIFNTPCKEQANELYEPDSPEYQEYLEQCYEENADKFVSIGKYAVMAGVGIGAIILVMVFKK